MSRQPLLHRGSGTDSADANNQWDSVTRNMSRVSTVTVPSLSNNNSSSKEGIFDDDHDEIVNTELYTNFKEAFNITLRNNPTILPGAPSVIKSIQDALFKVQKNRAQKENEKRKQLDRAMAEKDKVEAALRRELEVASRVRDEQQDALNKEITAVEHIKNELKTKMSQVSIEKTELTKHLRYISKSRNELEKTLETELQLVEKTRYDLQQVVKERNKMQKQKEENKVLMSEIKQITKATSKERKELESEADELKKLKEEIQQLKQSNEATRQSLEQEKKQLAKFASEMSTKKSIMMESKSEIETQFQKELEELENGIQTRRRMHEKDLETVVKRKVMSWRDKKEGEDIQSLINTCIDAKLNVSAPLERGTDTEAREEISPETPRPKQRHRTTNRKSPTDDSEDLREEIRYLTEKLEMMDQQQQFRHTEYPTQRCVHPRMSPGYSSRRYSDTRSSADDDIRKGPPSRIPPRNSDRRKSYSRYEERDDLDSGLYNRRHGCEEYRDNYDYTRRGIRLTQSPPISRRERHLPSHLDMRSPFY